MWAKSLFSCEYSIRSFRGADFFICWNVETTPSKYGFRGLSMRRKFFLTKPKLLPFLWPTSRGIKIFFQNPWIFALPKAFRWRKLKIASFSQKADQTTFYSPTEGERKVFEFFSENTPPICPTDLRMTKRQDFFENFWKWGPQ